jgi:hypothetical protein
MKRHLLLSIITLLFSFLSFAQNRNSNWCFGDSAGIKFVGSTTTLFISAVKSRGSAVSISDSTGQLLFSAYTRATLPGNTTLIKDVSNQIMQNGSNIVGEGWYQELATIPDPGNSSKYYLFSLSVTDGLGFYYSVIDMSLNGGLGAVIQKNVQLQNFHADDCVQAIKHGNGRDWWVITRSSYDSGEFYEYLITPSGISSVNIFYLDTATNNNVYHFTFSKSGNKIIAVDTWGLIDLFDFDRCTGVMTHNQTISNEVTSGNLPYYFSVEFSPNERYIYVSAWPDPSNGNFLFQFDLQAPNIFNSIDTIWHQATPTGSAGFLKLARNNKIYFASVWYDGMNFPYPYPNDTFNIVNNNLSVINRPDSAGDSCLFTPFSFNLGGGRCYWGLPNNPDYEMGSVAPCDSLTTIADGRLT